MSHTPPSLRPNRREFLTTAAAALAAAGLHAAAPLANADWPGWRGPTGQGLYAGPALPIEWGGKANAGVLWKAPLPGAAAKAALDLNQSSPIVVGDKIVITASYWPGPKADSKQIPEHHVACYQVADGKLLWDEVIKPGPWQFTDLRGGYTAPTPAGDADRIYVVFGSAVIAALDWQGKLVWRKEINPFKFDVALAASPVLHGKNVILQCDQVDKQSRLLAWDRVTGELALEVKRPAQGFAHSTPILAKVGDKEQLIVSASNALQGLEPGTGNVIWTCATKGDTVSPVVGGGIVYIDSGRGGSGYAVDPTGTGDVTKTHIRWKIPTMPDGYSSPVVVGKHLYRVHNPDVLKCIDLTTGEIVYSERLSGLSAAVSPIATTEGNLYFGSAGKCFVVKAGATFELLATNDLGDASQASAAAAGGMLFLKGRQSLYCVGMK